MILELVTIHGKPDNRKGQKLVGGETAKSTDQSAVGQSDGAERW